MDAIWRKTLRSKDSTSTLLDATLTPSDAIPQHSLYTLSSRNVHVLKALSLHQTALRPTRVPPRRFRRPTEECRPTSKIAPLRHLIVPGMRAPLLLASTDALTTEDVAAGHHAHPPVEHALRWRVIAASLRVLRREKS